MALRVSTRLVRADDHEIPRTAPDAHREIDTDVGARRDFDVLLHLGIEAGHLDFDLVDAARQSLEVEEAGGVRGRWCRTSCVRPIRR